MSSKNLWPETHRKEAGEIIARGVSVQKSRNLSDIRMVAEYPDLGSAKTWRARMCSGSLDGLHPDRTLERLKRFICILEGGQPDTTFYKELPFALEVAARVRLLERSTNDRRILVVLSPNGCGKTTVARWLVNQSRTSRAYVRMRPSWRNKPLHIANGIAEALGADRHATNAAEGEEIIIKLLSGHPRTLFIDQAHEGGPALMHMLRSLVDETARSKSRFVYLGYDTAFRRVQCATTDSLIEAQAFLGRCQKPIFDSYRDGVLPKDVILFLEKSTGLDGDTVRGVATQVTPALARSTNLRLLEDAVESARAASEDDEPVPERIVSEVFRLCGHDPKTVPTLARDED